jgi:hypothetical protein
MVDGRQKSFVLEGVWKSPVAPAVNMTVDVELDEAGAVSGLAAVDPQQLAREKMEQLGAVAQEQGKQAAAMARQGIGKLAGRMGKLALGCTVVLWVAWFSFPVIGFSTAALGVPAVRWFTLWDYQGVYWSPGTVPPALQSDGFPLPSHGAVSLLGLLLIAAPLAAPFLRDWRARFLDAGPLAYLVVLFLKYQWDVHRAAENVNALARSDSLYGGILAEQLNAAMQGTSWEYGAYILVAASVVLALRVFRRV